MFNLTLVNLAGVLLLDQPSNCSFIEQTHDDNQTDMSFVWILVWNLIAKNGLFC